MESSMTQLSLSRKSSIQKSTVPQIILYPFWICIYKYIQHWHSSCSVAHVSSNRQLKMFSGHFSQENHFGVKVCLVSWSVPLLHQPLSQICTFALDCELDGVCRERWDNIRWKLPWRISSKGILSHHINIYLTKSLDDVSAHSLLPFLGSRLFGDRSAWVGLHQREAHWTSLQSLSQRTACVPGQWGRPELWVYDRALHCCVSRLASQSSEDYNSPLPNSGKFNFDYCTEVMLTIN